MAVGEGVPVRLPLPSPGEIARLPPDGGEEFNRLVFEKSPYLLQHARNPVDWWPWCEEAFERARAEDKPVLLSVGYATCHWCHVMEHESFEDAEVAQLINERFIPVKVDREERPDIDEVYMRITQGITGGGGWPMTVALTPGKHAFFAGTYFPRHAQPGRPGIEMVVLQLSEAWTERREEVVETAGNITDQLGRMMAGAPGPALEAGLLDEAFTLFERRFDQVQGGFGGVPKFPVAPNLSFLLRYHVRTGNEDALAMVEKTLNGMRLGGIYDHIGFGFHRYSTTRDWLLPHFEKMLYDQALAVISYVEAYQVTRDERYERTAREILAYVLRDMTGERGGFYSAEDADSEGEEGRFYVWSTDEVHTVLGAGDGQWFADTFRFEDAGNYLDEATRERTGKNIPHLAGELTAGERARFNSVRQRLFARRVARVPPQKDHKILTDWNGLMISAFAKASQALGDESYGEAAKRAADFVLSDLRAEEGRLLKRYRQGEAGLTAHLEDYAFFISGLLDLYESVFETTYLREAIALQRVMDELFWDDQSGGYFMTADDAEELIVRAKKLYGGAIPSGNSVAIANLGRLHRITGDASYRGRAEETLQSFAGEIARSPSSFPMALGAYDFLLGPSCEIVVTGDREDPAVQELLRVALTPFLPNKVVLVRPGGESPELDEIAPYTKGQGHVQGRPAAYVCVDFACRLPATEPDELRDLLREVGGRNSE